MLLWGVASKPAMEHSQSVQAKILENLRFDPVTETGRDIMEFIESQYIYTVYTVYTCIHLLSIKVDSSS